MMIYGAIMMGSVLVLVLVAYFSIKDMDLSFALAGLLGLYLLMCTYAAIGLFMSTLTSYQIVAALGTLTLISFLNFIGNLWQNIEGVRDIMHWFSLEGRADESMRGLICSEDIIYFILVSTMFIGFAVLKLQFARRSCSTPVKIVKYVGLAICIMLLGYITSRPTMKFFYDATANKDRTITPNSQRILSRLDGGLTITSYVNLLDHNSYLGMPGNWANELYHFEQFIRFKPEIKMKYVYFYDNVAGTHYTSKEMEEKIEKIVITSGINPKKILDPEKIRERIDLSTEENRFVRVLERENGQRAYLRMFSDQNRYPSEAEISAVLKTMIDKSYRIAFLAGHGERSIYNANNFSYNSFTTVLDSREALINQGCEPFDLKLKEGGEISDDVDVLVIADPRNILTCDEFRQIKNYIDRGGNLLIAGDARRQQFVNPLLTMLGMGGIPGVLVQPKDGYSADLLFTTFTAQGGELQPRFGRMIELGGQVSMPSAFAIEVVEDYGFQMYPLLQTKEKGTWNELETKSFSLEEPELNLKIGECEKRYTTAWALQREVNGKDQRIIVLGDADCISNGELNVERGIRSGNYALLFGMFRWLINNDYPIDVSRPASLDNDIYLTSSDYDWIAIFLRWFCPAILLIVGCVLWLYRQMR